MNEIEKACMDGRVEEARELLATSEAGTADHSFLAGMVKEAEGFYEEAIDSYERALQLDATHRKTLFRLAYIYDLRGDEDLSVDYYKQCIQHPPVHVGALMNLAVLYEDRGDRAQLLERPDEAMTLYDEAEGYLTRILDVNPNQARAKLFLRDVQKSRSMYYDEEKERHADKRSQKLDIPVTDFELSVRSRNCLQKMEARTLGDLIKYTETDLLSYKNFGETSLSEIKQMLASQGLYLGMAKEQSEPKSDPPPGGAVASDTDMETPVTILDLSVRSQRCLEQLNLMTLGDLSKCSEKELMACKNFGRISLEKIKQALAKHNLALKASP